MQELLRSFGRAFLTSSLLLAAFVSAQAMESKKANAGLCVTYATGDGKFSDLDLAPSVSLYVPAGKTPSPFIREGKFTATWQGFIAVDLRGDYTFQAELNGNLKIEINTNIVLDITASDALSAPGKSIRLNKGTNLLKATFMAPDRGDAYVRLRWTPKGSFLQPVPLASLSHAESAELQKALQLHLGRELFVDYRCAKCHVGPDTKVAIPELSMDAPSFEDIGSRRNGEWLNAWIAHPKDLRSQARMPRMFHGQKSDAESAASVAAFLSSLVIGDNPVPKPFDLAHAPEGKKLFQTLHCTACHSDPGVTEKDVAKVSLKMVGVKFSPNALVDFLKKPDAHYGWIRMPRFKLTDKQREQLGAYLFANSEKPKGTPPVEKALLDNGKELVQTSGCLNCHGLKLENRFSTKTLTDLKDFNTGCLAANPEVTKAPSFQFVAAEREALQLFLTSDRSSLTRHVPAEFAERQTRALNCRNCHEGQVEGIPHFDLLGGKLKPEWSATFIAGEFPGKLRPWLENVQMPAFAKPAGLLAEGLAAQNGLPPQTPAEPAIDQDAVKIGNRLISAPPLGFSCIQCHSVGDFAATQVFEAPGVNLVYSSARLQPSYFKRWLRNPPLVDPSTKMPVFFDEEGKSPLVEVYDGDAMKQIDSVWQYLRLGNKMPPPQQAQ